MSRYQKCRGWFHCLQKVPPLVFILAFTLLLIVLSHIYLTRWPDQTSFTIHDFRCNGCNAITPQYILPNSQFCQDKYINVLYVIFSDPDNVETRTVIRQTWASRDDMHDHNVLRLFLFGSRNNQTTMASLHKEQEIHSDIVIADFNDVYFNLTLKTLHMLSWVRSYCSHASYVVKTDDDTFHQPANLVRYLAAEGQHLMVGGQCRYSNTDRSGKHVVTRSEYPLMFTPFYCFGGGYVLSKAAMTSLHQHAPHTVYHPMEDVFLTGLTRMNSGLTFTQIPGMGRRIGDVDPCKDPGDIVYIHKVTRADILSIWLRLKHRHLSDCSWTNQTSKVVLLVLFGVMWIYVLLEVTKIHRKSME